MIQSIKRPFRRHVASHHGLALIALAVGATIVLWFGQSHLEPVDASAVPATVSEPIQTPTPQPEAISGQLGPSAEAVEAEIRSVAKELDYQAPTFLVRLANCESSLRPWITNKTSGARGLFQIMPAHKDVDDRCAYDARCATTWTIKELMKGHASAWECTATLL